MDCKDIINYFLSYFKIPNKNNFSTVIDFLKDPKNKPYLNNFQQIFFYDLIKASNLFDNFGDLIDFFSNETRFNYLKKLFSNFSPFVSFRKLKVKTIDITGFENEDILSDLIFNGWDIEYNNPAFILSNISEYRPGTRYLRLSELKDILNPPSVFQFVYKKEYLNQRRKAMGFDIDGTLVNPSNILLPGVKEKLMELYQTGYNLILISNQKRRKIGDLKLKAKLEKICLQIDLPLIAYCAREEDFYRKPLPGISYLIPEWLGRLEGYVGDAAGRPGDHSSDDILLAQNLEIPFYTPEIYFNKTPLLNFNESPPLEEKNLILMIGYPGSGKSSYISKNLSNFKVVSRDDLKSMEKCEKMAEKYLSDGHNIVIDNVNFKLEDRERFINLGKKFGYNIIGVWIATGLEKSMEFSKKRENKVIPAVVYYKLRKEFQEPLIQEGFNKIFKVII